MGGTGETIVIRGAEVEGQIVDVRQGRVPAHANSFVGSPRYDFDRASRTRGGGQSLVGCDEGALQYLGERDVGGVIRRDVVAKLPNPADHADRRVTTHADALPRRERSFGVGGLEMVAQLEFADRVNDFGVDQVRSVQRLGGESRSGETSPQ